MGLNSRHNKYVSYPDWFGGQPKETTPTTSSSSTPRIVYAESGASGLQSITIYNKYVLKEQTLNNDILTLKDTALIAVKLDNNSVGDLVNAPGWSTTEFIDVAANTTITVNSSISTSYGIVYYDNTYEVISGETLDVSPKELVIPNSTCYFRISCLTDYTDFSIINKIPNPYTEEQLAISNVNVSDFTAVNTDIPEGINSYDITDASLKLLVQSPLELFKDSNNVIKLSVDGSIGSGNCEWELKTDELSGIEYLYSKYPVVTQYGVTMYADNSMLDLPDIYDGLPIDNSTIYWSINSNGDKILKARIFEGDITGTITPDEILDVVATAGYATQFWVTAQLEKKADLDYVNKTFVTIAGNEDVTGVHDFVNGLKIGGNLIYELQEDVLYINSNVVVRGGLTMFYDREINLPTIKDQIGNAGYDGSTGLASFNSNHFVITNGVVSLINPYDGSITGGLDYDQLEQYLTSNKYLKATDLSKYVTIDTDQTITGIKDFKYGFTVDGISITKSQSDVLYIDSNVIVRGGLTVFADSTVDVPSLMESIATDGTTIINDNGVLKLNPNLELGGITDAEYNALVSMINTKWTTDNSKITNWDTAYSWGNHAEAGYTTKEYVDSTFVTIAGNEDVTGIHNFVNGLKIGGNSIYESQEGVIYIGANVIVKGAVTMFADPDINIPSLVESLPLASTSQVGLAKFHPDYFTIDSEGFVVFIGETGENGGIADTITWQKVTGKPTWLSDDTISYAEIDGVPTFYDLTFQSGVFSANTYTPNVATKTINIPTTTSHITEGDNLYFTDTRAITALTSTLTKYLLLSGGTMTGTINSQIIRPKTTNTYTLGSSSYLWSNTYTKRLIVDTIEMYQSQSDVLYIDGNLVVRGGITLYGDDAVSASTIMNGILVDGTTISKSKGYLEVIGGVSGGGLDDLVMSGSGNAITSATLSNNILTLTKGFTFLTQDTADVRYVTGLGVNGDYLTWTKNGTANNITVPYATNADTLDSIHASGFYRSRRSTIKSSGIDTFELKNSGSYSVEYYSTSGALTHSGMLAVFGRYDSNASGSTGSVSSIEMLASDYRLNKEYPLKVRLSVDGNRYTSWKSLAFTDSNITGNAATATQVYVSKSESAAVGPFPFVYVNSTITGSGNTKLYFHKASIGVDPSTNSIVAPNFKGNATTATTASKLSTVSKTAWGQTYWTSGGVPTSISGDMSNVGNITMSGKLYVANTQGIYISNTSGTYNVVMSIDGGNNLCLGTGSTASGYATYLDGNTTIFRTSTTRTERMRVTADGKVGIGTTTPSYELHTVGTIYGSTNVYTDGIFQIISSGSYAKARLLCDSSNNYATGGAVFLQAGNYNGSTLNGSLIFSGINVRDLTICKIFGPLLVTGGITMYSDIRKKTKLADVELTLQQIADAPLIKHYYNSDETKTIRVGSIAQYWANMNDWFCKLDNDGYYTMEIQNAALASAISIARELVKYESKTDETIRLLKQRVNQLEDEVKRLKEN